MSTILKGSSGFTLKQSAFLASISVVEAGLLLYYNPSLLTSYPGTGTVLYDLSSNARNANLVNGTAFNSAYGGGFNFDGVNDQIVTATGFTSTDITFECFGKFLNKGTGFQYLFSYGDNTAEGKMISISLANQNYSSGGVSLNLKEIYCYLGGGLDSAQRRTNAVINFNQVYHVAITVKGGTSQLKMYLNGVNISPANATTLNLGNSLGLGYWFLGPQNYLYGSIYELRAYSKVLTQAEILQNYNVGKGRFGL